MARDLTAPLEVTDLLAVLEEGGRVVAARVDLDRLAANYRAVAAFAGRDLLPVVKADGYGHGAVAVATRLLAEGASQLAVASIEEGRILRTAGIQAKIVVLGIFTAEQVSAAWDQQLTPVVSTPAALAAASAGRANAEGRSVHLKVDTGMTRLGFSPDDVRGAAAKLRDGGLEIEGLMTHLASADESRETTERQLDLFDSVLAALEADGIRPPLVHAANSAGLSHLRPTHTLARPGILLYGLQPRPLSPPVDVRPVMSVSARIALVREVPAGTAVSYGGRFVTRRPSRLGTIPLGYADGVPRTAAMSAQGWLSVRGARAPVAGAVCMDFTSVDLTDVAGLGEADEAVLFGDSPTAWDLAEWAGTNAWQILTTVGPRVPRIHLESGRVVSVEWRCP
jgi:alanine racemase